MAAQRDPAPCGACGELVFLDEGCKHWKPMGRTPTTTGRKPSRRKLEREASLAAAELARTLGARP